METNREQTRMLVMSQIIPDKPEIRNRNSLLIQANIYDVSFNSGCFTIVSPPQVSLVKTTKISMPERSVTEKPSSSQPQSDGQSDRQAETDNVQANTSDAQDTHSGVSNEHTHHVRVCISFVDSGSSHIHRSQISSVADILTHTFTFVALFISKNKPRKGPFY